MKKRFDTFRNARPALTIFWWGMGMILVATGCGTAYYRNSADREAYGLIQTTRAHVLGETNEFNIDTAYSMRKPADISPDELIEDRLQTNERLLTIEDAIELAVRNSREYQAQKESLYLTALNLSGTRYDIGGSVQPFFGASADVTWSGTETTTEPNDTKGHRTASVTLGDPNNGNANGVTMSRLFRTGGRLTVDALNSVMLYYSGRPEISFSRISGSLIQPLLRGFGRNNDEVEALTQAERNLIYAVRNYGFYQDQFAVGIVRQYFGLLQQKDSIRNRYTNYLGRVQATKRLEARAVDRERLSDVDQARQAELTARNNYVDAVARYRSSLDQFKIVLGLPTGEKLYLDDTALDKMEATGLVPVPVDSETAFRLTVQRQPETLNFIDEFEDSKRKVRLAADKLKPGLKLVGNVELDTTDTDYTRFNPKHVESDLALELDLPLDRIPRGNTYRRALIDFESRLRQFTARLDNLKNDIENGLRTLEQRRQNYEIQKNALALATRRIESTTMMLEAGRAEVRNLIEAQDAQINAQTAVTSALVSYQDVRLQLMLDIGALNTELPQFWLADHLTAFLPPGSELATQTAPSQSILTPEESFRN